MEKLKAFDNCELRYDTYPSDGTRKCFQNRDDITEAHGNNSTRHVERNVNAKEARLEQALHSTRRLFIHAHIFNHRQEGASTKRRRFAPRWIPLFDQRFQSFVMHTVEKTNIWISGWSICLIFQPIPCTFSFLSFHLVSKSWRFFFFIYLFFFNTVYLVNVIIFQESDFVWKNSSKKDYRIIL